MATELLEGAAMNEALSSKDKQKQQQQQKINGHESTMAARCDRRTDDI